MPKNLPEIMVIVCGVELRMCYVGPRRRRRGSRWFFAVEPLRFRDRIELPSILIMRNLAGKYLDSYFIGSPLSRFEIAEGTSREMRAAFLAAVAARSTFLTNS
jgi:hypothetical protein